MKAAVEELANRIVLWVRDVVSKTSSTGVVFGMSGGIDSSVVAVLCKRACPESCLGLIMPCHSNPIDREHAEFVAQKFAVPHKVVVLDDVFDVFVKTLPPLEGDFHSARLAIANIKPRLRMVTLYYFANRLGYLVVGASNRSELAVGYFTKYGDGGVDIMPLGNLVKAQVRELARYVGIPREIIDKPPSAGLWEGQTDEGEMGVTYEELDQYLVGEQTGRQVKEKIDYMATRSLHKRSLPLVPPF